MMNNDIREPLMSGEHANNRDHDYGPEPRGGGWNCCGMLRGFDELRRTDILFGGTFLSLMVITWNAVQIISSIFFMTNDPTLFNERITWHWWLLADGGRVFFIITLRCLWMVRGSSPILSYLLKELLLWFNVFGFFLGVLGYPAFAIYLLIEEQFSDVSSILLLGLLSLLFHAILSTPGLIHLYAPSTSRGLAAEAQAIPQGHVLGSGGGQQSGVAMRSAMIQQAAASAHAQVQAAAMAAQEQLELEAAMAQSRQAAGIAAPVHMPELSTAGLVALPEPEISHEEKERRDKENRERQEIITQQDEQYAAALARDVQVSDVVSSTAPEPIELKEGDDVRLIPKEAQSQQQEIHQDDEEHNELQQEPDLSDEDVISCRVRLPNGVIIKRQFRESDTMKSMFSFVSREYKSEGFKGDFQLVSSFPRSVYKKSKRTLKDEGLTATNKQKQVTLLLEQL